ncbi:MAG: DNA methyltransferase [Bacteroidota bacterium]
MPTDEYFEQLFRVSKNQMIWGGNYFGIPACKFYIIWDKQMPDGLTFADCEMCWTSFDFAPRIFRYSTYLDKQIKFHPTQKPIALYKWLLSNYAKKGDRILDTHLGSGSSRIAAYDMGFDFVGYELDAEYFDAMNKRFAAHISRPAMFAPDEMYRIEQKKLFET